MKKLKAVFGKEVEMEHAYDMNIINMSLKCTVKFSSRKKKRKPRFVTRRSRCAG